MSNSNCERHPVSLFQQTDEFIRDFSRFAGKRGVFSVIFVALGAVLEGAGLVLLVPILTIFTNSSAANGWILRMTFHFFEEFGAHTRLQRLLLLLALFAMLMIVRAVVTSVRDVTLFRLQIGFVEAQRMLITRRLAAARWDVVARLRHARIMHLMSGDIQQIGVATSFLMQCGISAVLLLSQCVLAFMLSPVLALIAYLLFAAGALTMAPILRRARDVGNFVTCANLELMNSASQFLGGLKLAVSQNLQDNFVIEFEETLHNLTVMQIEYSRQQTNRLLAQGLMFAFVGALTVLIGFGVLNIAPALLMTLLFILARSNGPVTQIQQCAQQLVQSLPAYGKIKELEGELAAAAPIEAAAPMDAATPRLDGAIVFHAVGFSYADEPLAESITLCNLDLTIPPGAFVGIAGPSGAGKTTFADLLAGLFPPQMGQISIEGVTLDEAVLPAWRNQISYVSQDPFLFHDTIRRNLLWARPELSEEELWNALRLVGAENLVLRMEHGLETVVGERGTLVSGGERQRLALARAILRCPRVLIMDEATSAIDVEGERALLERLLAIRPRMTIVMIAHRAESLSLCDRVLKLADGRLLNLDDDDPTKSAQPSLEVM